MTLLLLAAFMAGCACHRCDQDRERMQSEIGSPEDIEIVAQGDRTTETWFYWSLGRSVVFYWDEDECSCSVNTFTYEPIEEELAGKRTVDELKAFVRDGGVLDEVRFSTSSSNPYKP
ncbi:MAG: hypothetical protein GY835_26905 [bacterium]|nr:hypothetical protein [bacterium]